MPKILAAVVAAVLTGAAGALLGYWSSNRQMDVKMVEIAVGILSQEPTDNIAPAREWAVAVIDHYSAPVRPSEAAKKALVEHKAVAIGRWVESYSEAIDYTYPSVHPVPDQKSRPK